MDQEDPSLVNYFSKITDIHMVSAFASEANLVLGQIKVDEKLDSIS